MATTKATSEKRGDSAGTDSVQRSTPIARATRPGEQRYRGNQAMQAEAMPEVVEHALPAPAITLQASLSVSRPDDPLEREAERVAEEVLRMPAPVLADEQQATVAIDQPIIHRLPAGTSPRPGHPVVTPAIETQIRGLQGGGQPLPDTARAYFEPRFGYDFGDVRVHSDDRAANLAQSVSARAFTVGQDVVFGAGQYVPGSGAGRRLLGHELVHVVQQNQSKPPSHNLRMKIYRQQEEKPDSKREEEKPDSKQRSWFSDPGMRYINIDGGELKTDTSEGVDYYRKVVFANDRICLPVPCNLHHVKGAVVHNWIEVYEYLDSGTEIGPYTILGTLHGMVYAMSRHFSQLTGRPNVIAYNRNYFVKDLKDQASASTKVAGFFNSLPKCIKKRNNPTVEIESFCE